MGQISKFTCPGCNYEAEVSGGRDRGFFSRTATIACEQCKMLYDVLVGKADSADGFEATVWTAVSITVIIAWSSESWLRSGCGCEVA